MMYLKKFLMNNLGDVTFAEAYQQSKRHINIVIAPYNTAQNPRIMNALTAPNALKDLTTLRKFCGEHTDACIAKENKDEFSFYYVGELCVFWIRLITRKGDYNMYLNAYTKEENYQKYFDFLEKLRQSGETNMYGAAPYLQSEFPELRGSQKKANAILIAWIKTFETEEGDEPC